MRAALSDVDLVFGRDMEGSDALVSPEYRTSYAGTRNMGEEVRFEWMPGHEAGGLTRIWVGAQRNAIYFSGCARVWVTVSRDV